MKEQGTVSFKFIIKLCPMNYVNFVVISNWVTANASIEKQSSKMVVAQNILAIRKGFV